MKRGETPPSVVRQSVSNGKQMYFPILTAEGIIADYYVPRKDPVNSAMRTTNVVSVINAWWQNRLKALSISERNTIRHRVSCLVTAGNAAITECGFEHDRTNNHILPKPFLFGEGITIYFSNLFPYRFFY